MSRAFDEIVIIGITESGRNFRPSDWAERLCGCISAFGEDQRLRYSPYVKPVLAEGVKCVVVHRRLEEVDPVAYSFLMSFARDNELRVREGRHVLRSPAVQKSVVALEMKSPQI